MGLIESKPLQTVDQVVPEFYSGLWYELARKPNNFENDDNYDVTAEYTFNRDGSIVVINSEYVDGNRKVVVGNARAVDNSNTKLKVSFVPFIEGDYFVLDLGPVVDGKYSYVVVGNSIGSMFWVLSRTKCLCNLDEILEKFKDVVGDSRIIKAPQN